jgi:hypothetical protein
MVFEGVELRKQHFYLDPLGKPDIWRSGDPRKYASDSYMIHRRHLQNKLSAGRA